jgi:branched-chain amino acid transport system permease protein
VDGILAGAIYATLAVGLNITLGVANILNFAQGEFMMLGMFATYFLLTFIAVPFSITIAIVFFLFFAGGIGLDAVLFKRARKLNEVAQIILTVAISSFLINFMSYVFSPTFKSVELSFAMESVSFYSIQANVAELLLLAYVIAAVWLSHLFLTRTKVGLAIRAVSQDSTLASSLGINNDRMYGVALGLSLALTAVGGTMVMPFSAVYPSVGSVYFLLALVVIVLGGLGSALGAFVGAMLLGIVSSFSTFYLGGLSYMVVYVIFIAVLLIRPQGIFGARMRI